MMRAASVTLALALAVPALAAPGPGQKLVLNWCDATSPAQQFAVAAGAVTAAAGTLCITQSSPYPAALTLQPCIPGDATQNWVFARLRARAASWSAGSARWWGCARGGMPLRSPCR